MTNIFVWTFGDIVGLVIFAVIVFFIVGAIAIDVVRSLWKRLTKRTPSR